MMATGRGAVARELERTHMVVNEPREAGGQ